MRKAKRLIAGVLAGVSLLSACSFVQTSAQENSPSYVTLNEFDNSLYLNYFMMMNALGKVSLNTDTAYVKNGEGSAKVWVQPDPFDGYLGYRTPYLAHATELKLQGLDYRDYSSVTAVEVDVFNPQDTVEEIGLWHVWSTRHRTHTGTETVWTELAPNSWTTVTLPVDLSLMELPDFCEGKYIKGVAISFKRPSADSEGKTFYLDGLRLKIHE